MAPIDRHRSYRQQKSRNVIAVSPEFISIKKGKSYSAVFMNITLNNVRYGLINMSFEADTSSKLISYCKNKKPWSRLLYNLQCKIIPFNQAQYCTISLRMYHKINKVAPYA